MSSLIAKVLHNLKMWFSKKYAAKVFADGVIQQIQKAVSGCANSKAPIKQIRDLVTELQYSVHRPRVLEAIAILAASNNFDCMALAIEYDHSQGKPCADKLMAVAREHLQLCGHGDRAHWARKRLFLAREWYDIANAFTAQLDAEIETGMKATDWIAVRPLRH